jgi:hypothetical protein
MVMIAKRGSKSFVARIRTQHHCYAMHKTTAMALGLASAGSATAMRPVQESRVGTWLEVEAARHSGFRTVFLRRAQHRAPGLTS